MADDRAKLGGLALILAAILILVGNILHPRTETGSLGASSVASETRLIADNLGVWYPSHIALILFPVFVSIGYLVLYRTLRDKGERNYSFTGLVMIALAVPLLIVSLVLDGFVTPLLAQQYLAANGEAQARAGDLFMYNFLVSVSLLGPAFLLYFAGVGCIGRSLVITNVFGRWVGWAGVGIGVVGIAGYVAGLFGPYWVLSAAFTPLALVLTAWVLAVGVLFYRSATPPKAGPAEKPAA